MTFVSMRLIAANNRIIWSLDIHDIHLFHPPINETFIKLQTCNVSPIGLNDLEKVVIENELISFHFDMRF